MMIVRRLGMIGVGLVFVALLLVWITPAFAGLSHAPMVAVIMRDGTTMLFDPAMSITRPIAHDTRGSGQRIWSPDGRYLLIETEDVTMETAERVTLEIFDTMTGRTTVLARDRTLYEQFQWSVDSRSVEASTRNGMTRLIVRDDPATEPTRNQPPNAHPVPEEMSDYNLLWRP